MRKYNSSQDLLMRVGALLVASTTTRAGSICNLPRVRPPVLGLERPFACWVHNLAVTEHLSMHHR